MSEGQSQGSAFARQRGEEQHVRKEDMKENEGEMEQLRHTPRGNSAYQVLQEKSCEQTIQYTGLTDTEGQAVCHSPDALCS